MSDIIFIINPNSGKKKADLLLKKIKSEFPEADCYITKSIEEFDVFMHENINKYTLFVVVGGDGSVKSTVEHLIGKSDKILAVYPAGSGNGFARELGYKANLKHLKQAVNQMKIRPIDIPKINDEYCANVAGVGFDAAIAHAFSKLNTRGFWSYFKLVVKTMFSFPAFETEINYGDKSLVSSCLMMSFANTRQFGNNALIAPAAKPDDGLLDIAIMKNCSRLYFPIFAIKLMTGRLKPSKYYKYLQTNSEIIVKTKFNQFHIDGDPKTFADDVSIKISDKKLNILDCR